MKASLQPKPMYCSREYYYPSRCHFGFPKPPASRTVISWQPSEEDKAEDIIKYAKDVLQNVQNFLSSTQIANDYLSIADFLQNIGIDLDTYMQALQISQKGQRIILQWNPCDNFINPCCCVRPLLSLIPFPYTSRVYMCLIFISHIAYTLLIFRLASLCSLR